MSSSLTATEEASALVATQPRITKRFIENQISRIIFSTGDALVAGSVTPADDNGEYVNGDPVGPCPNGWRPIYDHHTLCLITTKTGFTVVGHSAPASPGNFNENLGRQFAYENAFRQLWPLFAFTALAMVDAGVTYGDFGQEL